MSSGSRFIIEASRTAINLSGWVGLDFWEKWEQTPQFITIGGEQASGRLGFRDDDRMQYQCLYATRASDRQPFDVRISATGERERRVSGYSDPDIIMRLRDPRHQQRVQNSDVYVFWGLAFLQDPEKAAGAFRYRLCNYAAPTRTI